MEAKITGPMTTAEFFDRICEILVEKKQMPEDILDYRIAEYNPVPVTTYEFAVRSNLDYGGSEGIYLDVWMERQECGKRKAYGMGTFKTLEDTPEAMRAMAQLLADFLVAERKYVNGNIDAFTWEGADVYPVDEKGNKSGWGYGCKTMESAIRKKDGLLKKYSRVIVRDNASRRETVYGKEGGGND